MTFNWKNILISAVYISTDFIGMSSSLKLQSTSLIKLAIRQDSGNISDVLNSIPLQCQETCNTLLTTLTECQSPNCICTNETGQKLESCLECIISVAPIQGQIDKGQELLNSFNAECAGFGLNPLTIAVTAPPVVQTSTAASAPVAGTPTANITTTAIETSGASGKPPSSISTVSTPTSTSTSSSGAQEQGQGQGNSNSALGLVCTAKDAVIMTIGALLLVQLNV